MGDEFTYLCDRAKVRKIVEILQINKVKLLIVDGKLYSHKAFPRGIPLN